MRIDLPEERWEGFIFDCDGTLADTMPTHYAAWVEALGGRGAEVFSEELFYYLGGTKTSRIVEILNERFDLGLSVSETVRRKEEAYLARLGEIGPIPAVVELAWRLRERFPLAVASGGLRRLVLSTLDAIGMRDAFRAIVTAEDVVHGKPSPEPFLLAADRIGTSADQCLVFEDSPTGLEAARAAGMDWVLVQADGVRFSWEE